MNTTAKVLVPNKVWILEDSGVKLGTLNKESSGYSFFNKGTKFRLLNLNEVKLRFGSEIFKDLPPVAKPNLQISSTAIYDYPCSSKPFNPVYNLRKKLLIYAKSSKSKSLYCAGHYIIKFRKGWVRSFCPKLITLERYPYQGPFKTEEDMKVALTGTNKHNTLPIENFIDKARIAVKSNQKALLLDIKEVQSLAESLAVVMTRVAGNIDAELQLSKAETSNSVNMDGGGFV